MNQFFWVCAGGAFGTGIRYAVALWLPTAYGAGFPYATLLVNLLGSFLLGAIAHFALATELLSPTVRLALTTGIMGGLTTYSTFNFEALAYLRGGAWHLACLYICVTVLGCLAAGMLGLVAGRWVSGLLALLDSHGH